jgi:hypothetical protein
VARLKPLLSKRHMTARLEFAKRYLKWETRFSGLMKPRLSSWPEWQASRLEETWHHPYGEAWWWQHLALGMFYGKYELIFAFYTCWLSLHIPETWNRYSRLEDIQAVVKFLMRKLSKWVWKHFIWYCCVLRKRWCDIITSSCFYGHKIL